jgi:hypothetical protein
MVKAENSGEPAMRIVFGCQLSLGRSWPLEGEAPAEPQGCAEVRVFGFVGDERWGTEQVRGGRRSAWASR